MVTERAISDLEQALADHRAWAVRLHRRLIAGMPALPDDVAGDAHHRCAFGRWYDGVRAEAQPVLAGDDEFAAIGAVHQAMHAHARALLETPPSDTRLAHYDAFAAASEHLAAAVRRLQQALLTRLLSLDALTGLPGRRHMEERLSLAWQQSRREGRPAAVAMMDLDHFKQVNDRDGHAAGDEVLRWIGAGARRQLRAHDLVFRYGGEEFVAFLADSSLDAALGTLERIRRVLESSPLILDDGRTLRITASFGLAACREDAPVSATLEQADRALYEAKRRGRNRVVCWQGGGFA
ncbi:MAG: diguanylate cyclase [Burkholderiaceae bacterium]|nr:diguanylate cyclase [Burkholderiaceae bacterium]